MNSDKFKGFSVLSLTEGIQFGHVVASLFDPASLILRALQIKGDGQSFLVPLDQIGTIGTDAIMVENSRVTRALIKEGEFGGLVQFDTLKHLKVVDTAGTFLGTLQDLDVDLITGEPRRIAAHKGGFFHLGGETVTLEAVVIRSVGSDLITIAHCVTAADIAPQTTNVAAPALDAVPVA